MSGHSKWANIKHKKGKTDALKAKLATKIGREITVAARMGGADPTGNMRLKLALQKARENNIPKDNIQRAIDKGVGATDMNAYEEIVYEGYGPAGVAVTVEVMTDNRNRAAADVRHAFLRTIHTHDLVGHEFHSKTCLVEISHSFQHLRPVCQCIFIIFRILAGFLHGFHDMIRRLKIRCSHRKIINCASGLYKFFLLCIQYRKDTFLYSKCSF